MALDQYHHGVTVVETTDGSQTIQTVSTAIIGMVCWAQDADTKAFPLDTPVLITDISTAIGNAGKSGSLVGALTAIGNQVSAPIVVVRVDDGTAKAAAKAAVDAQADKPAATEPTAAEKLVSNIVGTTDSKGKKTGLQALLIAESTLGVRPRIIGVPGMADADVTAAVVTIAQKLKAFAYSAIKATKVTDAITEVGKMSGRELMPIYGDFSGLDPATGKDGTISAVACALGLRARLDQEVGWHRCLSNVAVNSVTGITNPVSWDLQSTDTDADLLNKANTTALIQRSGYRFWGVRTCDDTGAYTFESYTRSAQVIADTIADAHFNVIDKPLTPMLAREIIDNINAKMRQWVGLGYLLGGEAWIDAKVNEKETLKGGQLIINYKFTPIPPLENLGFTQEITDSYLADFAAQVTA